MQNLFEHSSIFYIPETKPQDLSQEGNNLKNILVAISSDDLNEETKVLLLNILKAVDCNLDEDAILLQLNANQEINIKEFISQFDSKYVLSFGLSPSQMALNIVSKGNNYFEISSTQFLLSSSLQVLNSDRNKKIKLWNQLKIMFRQ